MGPVTELEATADACAARLCEVDRVLVASHIDADGLTSAAIATSGLRRAGIAVDTAFYKQLDDDAIAKLARANVETVLFTDFGSGQLETIASHRDRFTPIVADHHQPAATDIEFHLNPLLEGIDGAAELSGAGTTYVLARALAAHRETKEPTDNRDLAGLAVVGAVGDMQAVGGELRGANSAIVAEGVEAGVLAEETDLALYGRQTRPLPKLLEYASDIHIPGISNDEAGAVAFLQDLDIDLTGGESDWRRWVELSAAERQTVASGLVRRGIERGVPANKIEQLVGTTYTLVDEPIGTEHRDASEFSTLLNATARYERADVGLAVCLGDRGEALDRARTLLQTHRRNLSEGLEFVKQRGVEQAEHIQYFDAGEAIRDTIVGIVAGMALGVDGVDGTRPIIAFAVESEAETKVSGRGTGTLVGRGLDLSTVMAEAAGSVGGDGGGHDIAAGATIPRGVEDDFVEAADAIVGRQLG